MAITEELGYPKVCVCWAQKMMTDACNETRKATATYLLHHYNTGGQGSPSQLSWGMKHGSTIQNPNPIDN
jgi:hypothetical protein